MPLELPWDHWMQWALGVLGWAPKDFWSATPVELKHAIKGWKSSNGIDEDASVSNKKILSRSEVDELKEMMVDHGD